MRRARRAPVAVYEALQARARYGVDVRQIGRTPLVGRERELDALTAALARARTEREPQLVTIVGVPGIGKSRLVFELFRGLHAEPDLTTWRQGRSPPLRRRRLLLGARRDRQGAGRHPRHRRRRRGLQRSWVARSRTSLPSSGKRSGSSATCVRSWGWAQSQSSAPTAAARRSPRGGASSRRWPRHGLWCSSSRISTSPTTACSTSSTTSSSGRPACPLLAIGTARPELLARRPGWGGGKANALTLSLSSLSDTETAQIVHALLDQAVLPAELQQRLLQRAEGNPLYAEEFARLVAEGRQPEELPETVQGIVAARLDALATEEKQALQDAAVLGKVFWLGAVAHLSEQRAVGARGAAARARAKGVRAAGTTAHRLRRDGVRVQAPARPRRRLRADPAC